MRATFLSTTVFIVGLAFLAQPAAASEGFYATLGGSVGFADSSSNEGAFTSDFTTGAGTTIPGGVVLSAGTDLGWDTKFDTGYGIFGALGYALGNGLRGELEVAYRSNDVKSHANVAAGGIPLDAEDAGVLITGSSNLGISVGDLVADGQGDVSSFSVMANVFYDFHMEESPFVPFIGGGIGYADVDVDFMPSATPIISDSDGSFAWQLMAGAGYQISESTQIFVGYRYFQAGSSTVSVDLLPAALDVDYQIHSIELGLRFFFN